MLSLALYTSEEWSRELTNLVKLYNREEYKYGGDSSDSFDYKMDIWISFCQQADIPRASLHAAFPQMLKGLALDYYFTNYQKSAILLKDICQKIKNNFEGKKRARTL
jgi:hypothetical protein